jgi:serine/threonine protein kinase
MSVEVSQPVGALDALEEHANAESLELPAEHAPSSALQALAPQNVAPHASNRPSIPPPAELGVVGSTPAELGIAEDHRQSVANILQSLTGSTLLAVENANAATERRCRELIGQRVNNFEIIGLLSSGGMGDVFEAIHLVIHRKVAIKVLRQEHVSDPGLVQRFFNEARAANSIRHPNIVEILDVGMLPGGLPYIAMERLEGETLAQRLSREGKLEIERAVDFAVQAASALQAAHKRGIVHRDLKPDNLFIVADPRVAGRELIKVLDFGIAKLHGDKLSQVKTNVGSILGTPPYMSPEQCRGIPDAVDHRSDVYALGVILFEMLCGAPPFVAEGVGEVMVMHLSSPPPLPRWRRQEIPLRIEQTILWAMEKNPDQRIPSMGDFAFTLCSGPTPVPYIITPTGLTTAELPQGGYFTPSPVAPRYHAPAISLEGEFPTEEAPPTDVPLYGRVARVERRNSTPPQGYRRNSAPPDAERDVRASSLPPPSRTSWHAVASRGVAIGAFGVAAAAAAVIGFGQLGPGGHRSVSRVSELPPTVVGNDAVAAGERDLGVATASLRTSNVVTPTPIEIVPDAELPRADDGVEQPVAVPAGTVPSIPNVTPRVATPATRWVPRGYARASAPAVETDQQAVIDAAESLRLAPAAAPVADLVSPVELGPVEGMGPIPMAPNTSTGSGLELPGSGEAAPHVPPISPVEATMGTLNFDSSPWARVSVDGRMLGVTPLRGVHLPPGTHQLRLENSELGTSTTVVVDIKSGQSVSRFVGWEQRP